MTSAAPKDRRYSASWGRPLLATTVKPSLLSRAIAKLPTPPAAPVTSTSPSAGFTPCFCNAMTHSIAVYPAVPIAKACLAVKPFGNGISQSALTLACWAKPPQWPSPTPQPLSKTASPTLNSGEVLSSTSPAKSIPGTIGKLLTTGPLPVIAKPSL